MESWFSTQTAQLFSFFALLSLLALMATWVKQGKHRNIVMGSYWTSIGLGVAMIVGALVAWISEQPSHVIWTLAWTGMLITGIFCATMPGIIKGYQKADQRRIIARDI